MTTSETRNFEFLAERDDASDWLDTLEEWGYSTVQVELQGDRADVRRITARKAEGVEVRS